MEDDGKKRPGEDDDLTPDEDAETPSSDGEESSNSEQEEFSLEGELVPKNEFDRSEEEVDEDESADESDSESEEVDQDKDSDQEPDEPDSEGGSEGEEESKSDENADDEAESDEDASQDGAHHEEESDSEKRAESESKVEDTGAVSSSEDSDYNYEEDHGYDHWHDDHADYHEDGYHDEGYHQDEETALASQVEKSVTELERHEDEDIAALDDAIEEGHMTFLEHLEELRIVLFKSAAAFLSAFILVAIFFRQITALLRTPVEKAMDNHGVTEALVTTSPFGVFSFLLQLGFLGGIALASPFILYFASSFIAPGLNEKERRTLLPGAFVALMLFCVGCVFSYTVLVPSALNVSIYLNELLGFSLVWAADRYMSLLIWMVLGIGLSFEFPLVITILVYVGILTVAMLKQFRRYAIVIIFILAAFITPTADPITQGLMAGPMILLYEAAIIVGGFIERRKRRAYEAEFGSWDDDDQD